MIFFEEFKVMYFLYFLTLQMLSESVVDQIGGHASDG